MAKAKEAEKVPLSFHPHQQFLALDWIHSRTGLNQVERFFALITGRMIRSLIFSLHRRTGTAIYKWLAPWNGKPTLFVWKASADVILDKVRRCEELSETGD
jgi:hypothetical protein